MSRIPARFGDYLYGSIQAAITTAVATVVAMVQSSGDLSLLLLSKSWLLSWFAMLPVVVFVAPLIRRAVMALTDSGDTGPGAGRVTAG